MVATDVTDVSNGRDWLLVDSRLAQGMVELACQEAETLHREHPADEGVSGLLMLALYRAGRPAEALSVYRRTRRGLREEFGVDPGTGLSELHTAILRRDPELPQDAVLRAGGGRSG